MGRTASSGTQIHRAAVLQYLKSHGHEDAEIVHMRMLGESTGDNLKAYGYGKPVWVRFTTRGATQDIVIRTMSADPFGHERHADRVGNLLLDFDTFNTIPRHIRALDVGCFAGDGKMVALARGEPFLITNYVEGELYAEDLHGLGTAEQASTGDIRRAELLAEYLVELHSQKANPNVYLRHVRDTIGSGEGIFGQTDGFAPNEKYAPQERLLELELAAVRWRWRLRNYTHRARRTHGDFHPFNILLNNNNELFILDCSRGGVGEPADDVTCLSINYILFALRSRNNFSGAHRDLWNAFWQKYLQQSRDTEMLDLVAPYFTWRILVVANPVWYPHLKDEARHRLLCMSERLLDGQPFTPDTIDDLLTP